MCLRSNHTALSLARNCRNLRSLDLCWCCKFIDRAAVASRNTMIPSEWWVMYGHSTPTLRKLAIRILSQTTSSSTCERNWSTFALIHTKQRNRLAYPRLEKLVFCYYNMKLRLRDMEAEDNRVAETDYLDVVDVAPESGDEEEDPLFQWIRPAHMDDAERNPDPKVAAVARECGIDVDRVMGEKVGVNSRSSGSGADTSADSGSNVGGGGGNEENYNFSDQVPLSPFTGERDFTHATQDLDHRSRAGGAGIGAIGKNYGRRHVWNESEGSNTDIESMSMTFDSMNMSNDPPYQPPYPQPEGRHSTSDWWTSLHEFHYPSTQMSHGSNMSQPSQPYWVNEHYPIHGHAVGRDRGAYEWHVYDYTQNWSNMVSWYQYCLNQDGMSSYSFEPHRSSCYY